MSEIGALVAALAKAQTQFAPVKRDRTVTVKMKQGGEYTFAYAPLDTILEAVRGPLSANGLAIVQMLDDGALVTSLMHESGAVVAGRVDLPQTTDIQQLGSAITYLRRYAIQAVLGIAAEDDDDGNSAAGNIASPAPRAARPTARPAATGTLWSGPVSKGQNPVDGMLRETADGPAFGFALTDQNGKRVQVLALGDMAHALSIACADGLPAEATVDGDLVMVPWQKDGKEMPPYRRVIASMVSTPDFRVPAAGGAPVAAVGRPVVDDDLDGLDF